MLKQNTRLLVADDHRLFIEGLQYVLKQDLNIEVAGFALNGKEAIEQCNSKYYDVVLMDIHMPVIDGIQATTNTRQLYPDIKIIILSTASDLSTVSNALKAGAHAYVLKDACSNELIKALHSVNKNEIYISSSIGHFFSDDSVKSIRKDYIQFTKNLITTREQAVLRLIADGHTNQQIADTLFISVGTADTHRKNLLGKLKVSNTAALVRFALENKLI
jgi:two-component system nitrate/nitrite response regulator NarL